MTYEQAKPFLKEGMKVKVLTSCIRCPLREHVVNDVSLNQLFSGGLSWYLDNKDTIEILTQPDGITPWEDPRETPADKPKFKVGDRVRIKEVSHLWTDVSINDIGLIARFDSSNIPICFITIKDNNVHWARPSELELLPSEEPNKQFYYTPPLDLYKLATIGWDFGEPEIIKPKIFKRKESKMNSVIQAIKAKLSPTDKVLVKNGYLNPDGTRTETYDAELKEMAMSKLIEAEDTKEFRKELAEELDEKS